MSWQEVAATVVLLLGLFAGAFLWAQRPAFWIAFFTRLGRALLPGVVSYLTKRMPPEKEAEWRDCMRRGGEWDHIRKRCK